MSDLKGTNVASTVRPFSDKDKFPTVLESEVKGGAHSVESFDEMYRIPLERRKLGMLCVVKGDKYAYRLINNPNSATTGAGDWDTLNIKASDVYMDDDTTPLNEKLAKMELVIHDRYLIFNLGNTGTDGVADVEITVPYESKIVDVNLSAPTDAVIEDEIKLAIEVYKKDTKKWKQVGTPVSIKKQDNTFTTNEEFDPNIPLVKDSIVRCNILKADERVKTLNVLVHIKTID